METTDSKFSPQSRIVSWFESLTGWSLKVPFAKGPFFAKGPSSAKGPCQRKRLIACQKQRTCRFTCELEIFLTFPKKFLSWQTPFLFVSQGKTPKFWIQNSGRLTMTLKCFQTISSLKFKFKFQMNASRTNIEYCLELLEGNRQTHDAIVTISLGSHSNFWIS